MRPYHKREAAAMKGPIADLSPPSTSELDHALLVLARCHTRDDDQMGFTVEYTPYLEYGIGEYIRAWSIVRRQLHLQTEPNRDK